MKCVITVGLLVVVEGRLVSQDRLRVAMLRLLFNVTLLGFTPCFTGECRATYHTIVRRFARTSDVIEVFEGTVAVQIARLVGVDYVELERCLRLHLRHD